MQLGALTRPDAWLETALFNAALFCLRWAVVECTYPIWQAYSDDDEIYKAVHYWVVWTCLHIFNHLAFVFRLNTNNTTPILSFICIDIPHKVMSFVGINVPLQRQAEDPSPYAELEELRIEVQELRFKNQELRETAEICDAASKNLISTQLKLQKTLQHYRLDMTDSWVAENTEFSSPEGTTTESISHPPTIEGVFRIWSFWPLINTEHDTPSPPTPSTLPKQMADLIAKQKKAWGTIFASTGQAEPIENAVSMAFESELQPRLQQLELALAERDEKLSATRARKNMSDEYRHALFVVMYELGMSTEVLDEQNMTTDEGWLKMIDGLGTDLAEGVRTLKMEINDLKHRLDKRTELHARELTMARFKYKAVDKQHEQPSSVTSVAESIPPPYDQPDNQIPLENMDPE